MSSAAVAPVSFVIPTYNCAAYLPAAIRCALDQEVAPTEVIVVDDGSTDDTPAVMKQFGPPVRCLTHQQQEGIGAARNSGVREASGQYIAFLDADDLCPPVKLRRQLAAFAADSGLDMVFAHVEEFFSEELGEEDRSRLQIRSEPAPGLLASTMLIRRRALDAVGPFRTDMKVGEFIDWYMRAQERGLRQSMLKEVLLRRRIHGANTGIRERQARSDYARILKQALERRRRQ